MGCLTFACRRRRLARRWDAAAEAARWADENEATDDNPNSTPQARSTGVDRYGSCCSGRCVHVALAVE